MAFAIGGLLYAVSLYIVGYRFFGSGIQRDTVLFAEGLKFLASVGCIYFLGVFLPAKERLLLVALISLAVLVPIAIGATDKRDLILDPNTWVGAPFEAANYQALARSLLPLAAIAMAFLKKHRYQSLIVGPTLLALFLIGGRSEFAAGLVLSAAWAFVVIIRQASRYVVLAAIVALILFSLTFGGIWLRASMYSGEQVDRGVVLSTEPATKIAPRQMEMVNLEGSASWQHRERLLKEGWAALIRSPIFGDYGGQIKSGGFGDYIHNALSAWRQFGILGFVLYVGGCVGAFLFSAKAVVFGRSNDPRLLLAFYLSAMSLVMILMFKAVFWTLPLLGWGLIAGYLAAGRRPSTIQ